MRVAPTRESIHTNRMTPSNGWSKVSQGVYQRPMGDNEKFIRCIGDRSHGIGREHWSLSATALFTFKPYENCDSINLCRSLREAWKLLRFHHPSIASRATSDDSLEYVIPDAAGLEAWLQKSFFEINDPSVDEDVLIAGLKPCPIVTLHFLVPRSQIILHTAHWRTDGYGAFQLIDALLAAFASTIESPPCLENMRWGEEISCLVPSVESALNLPEDAPQEVESLARSYLASGRHLHGTVGIPCRDYAGQQPQGTSHVSLQIPHDTTAALEAACHSQGIGLYSATHAAVAALNYARASAADRQNHYTSTIRLNLRPHLAEPYRTPAVASGLYTGGYMFRVEAGQSFIEHAKKYEDEYKSQPSQEFLLARRQYGRMALQAVKAGPPPLPPTSNIDVSFVTGADDLVSSVRMATKGVLEVVKLGLGVETLTKQAYCFFWNFGGRLELSLWFNVAYYDSGDASRMLEELHNILVSELL